MSDKGKKDIDLTRYVALGDSITSGYTDGALFYYGQQNSYPKLISDQFKLLSDCVFKQPLMNLGSVGVGFSGNARLVMKPGTDNSIGYLAPQGDLQALSENNYSTQGPFNNMGVPAAKVISLLKPGLGNSLNGPGNYNPFFTRMTSNPISASALSDTLVMRPTFFSLFIGNNDILTFALSGATSDSITPSSGPAGIGFKESINAIVNALTVNGAKGVIANIPAIDSLPYFTVIPNNGLVLNADSIFVLNEKYKDKNMLFQHGKNPFVIYESAAGNSEVRQMKKGEMVLFDVLLDPEKELFMKAVKPIPKKYILTNSEIAKIKNATNEYNDIIKSMVIEKDLAFVDIYSMMNEVKLKNTYNVESLSINNKKRSGFSLDGLHPNALGQALLANEFIKAINLTYELNIPLVKMMKYKRKILPV